MAARPDRPSHERGDHLLWTAPDPGLLRSAGQMQPGTGDDESIIRLPPSGPPDNVRYVGPQLDDPVWAAEQTWRRPGREPLVLVATSSIFQHQTGLLQRIAQALGNLPVQGLITTGQAVIRRRSKLRLTSRSCTPRRTAKCSPKRQSSSPMRAMEPSLKHWRPGCPSSAFPWAGIKRTTPSGCSGSEPACG